MFEPIPIAMLMAMMSGFAALKVNKGKRGFTVLAFAWLIYSIYELLMYKRVLCTGECNIRVDLLLIYPLMLGGTIWLYAAAGIRSIRKHRGASNT